MKILKIALGLFVAWGILVGGMALNQALSPSQPTPTTVGQAEQKMRQSPELVKMAKKLGVDISEVHVYFGTPKADNVKNPRGAFVYPNTIVISKNAPNKLTILAHEYMHYRYEGSKATVKLYRELKKGAWMQNRLVGYDCEEVCLAAEAEAYACTEMPQYFLSKGYKKYCDSFIPNRHLLF